MTEKTCNEFVKDMAEAGFDFTFTATNGNDVYIGDCKNGIVKSKRKLSNDELKSRIKEKLNN